MDKQREIAYFEEIKEEIGRDMERLSSEIDNEKEVIKRLKEYINDNFGDIDSMELSESIGDANNLVALADSDIRSLRNLGFLKGAPYFARIDIEDEQGGKRELRIGGGGFWSREDKRIKIYDWRAPVSSLYYDHDTGPASYTVRERTASGSENTTVNVNITERAQLLVRDGVLQDVVNTDERIADELLLDALSGNAPDKMRPVIATIQREQNAIIRDDESEVLVVDGRAGSGKTVIAMHRLAWLLYNKKHLNSGNVLILSPNHIFSDYISRIMPELMEEPIPEKHWDELMDEIILGRLDYESTAEQAERLKGLDENDAEYAALVLKSSRRFFEAINSYLDEVFIGRMEFKDFHYEKTVFPKERLEKMFFENFSSLPPYERFRSIAYFILDDYLMISGRNFQENRQARVQEQITNELIRRFAEPDLLKIYMDFLGVVKEVYPFAADIFTKDGRVRYEDMQVLFWLQVKLYGCRSYKDIKHVMIDEMQDYSIFRLAVIKEIFGGRKTFLGDRHQVIFEGEENVCDDLSFIFENCVIKELAMCYRQTAQITAYCNAFLDEAPAMLYHRNGSEVCELFYKNEDELASVIKEKIKDAKGSFGILCDSEEEAYGLYRRLGVPELVYLSEENAAYRGGLCIMAGFLSKGMEFDSVIVVSSETKSAILTGHSKKSSMYIKLTRALHELTVCFREEKC